MGQEIEPIWLPLNTAVRIRLDIDTPGELEIGVISGGPVFVWIGEDLDTASAVKRAAGGANMDWDLAAPAGGVVRRVKVPGGVGAVTMLAEVDSRVMATVTPRASCDCQTYCRLHMGNKQR